MNSTFFEQSKRIANDFLQNIVFIDDKAFDTPEENNNHEFDAYRVTSAFAKEGKICAVFRPKNSNDIENLSRLAKKADITVLDWQIHLESEPITQGTEEEDDEVVDPRGPHTLKIIKSILEPNQYAADGSVKLIIVYTGELGLGDITDDIHKALSEEGINNLNKDFCEVSTNNVKIHVIAKPDNETEPDGSVKSKFKHIPQFNARVKTYEELPEFILDEYAKMTSGLLSNFVLKSLSILRNNNSRFIQLYNKNLDQAFLSHRLMLPNQDDSNELLIAMFSDSVRALLSYNHADETISSDEINHWIDTQTFSKEIQVGSEKIKLDNDFLKAWVTSSFEETAESKLSSKNDDNSKAIAKAKGNLERSETFFSDVIDPFHVDFSILSHHKSLFKPTHISPKLTLGVVVKGDKTGYWVCIQQRCDSVRLSSERRFLFLPLEENENKFHFITGEGKKLRLMKKSFQLRTIKFGVEGESFIQASSNANGEFYFTPFYNSEEDEKYQWILDLKDLHAQRIANEFSGELARVGLDESEWLRRKYS